MRRRGSKFKVNDKEFFDKLFNENYETLLLVAYYVMEERDVSKADLLVQQIFYEAYKQIRAIRRSRDPKKKLFLIARSELKKAHESSEEKTDEDAKEKDERFNF